MISIYVHVPTPLSHISFKLIVAFPFHLKYPLLQRIDYIVSFGRFLTFIGIRSTDAMVFPAIPSEGVLMPFPNCRFLYISESPLRMSSGLRYRWQIYRKDVGLFDLPFYQTAIFFSLRRKFHIFKSHRIVCIFPEGMKRIFEQSIYFT